MRAPKTHFRFCLSLLLGTLALLSVSQSAPSRPERSNSIRERLNTILSTPAASRDAARPPNGRARAPQAASPAGASSPPAAPEGAVTGASASSPSNAELLLQYLDKRASSNSKSPQEFIDTIISKKAGVAAAREAVAEEDSGLVEVLDSQTCAQVPVSRPYECARKELKQTAYPCSLEFYPEVCTLVTRPMESKRPRDVERKVPYQCPKLRNKQLCYSVPKSQQTTCVGMVNKAKETECQRNHVQKSCTIVEESIPWTCHETKEIQLSYACSRVEPTTECSPNLVAIDDACTRETKVPVVYEYYDVEPEQQCEVVRKKNMCPKAVRSVDLYSCPETYYDKVCITVDVPVTRMCDAPVTITEEYPCEKTEVRTIKKACGFSQGARRFLRAEVEGQEGPAPAAAAAASSGRRRLCDYETTVTVPSTCTREVTVTKQQPCMQTEPQEQCSMVEKVREKTCESPSTRTVQAECEDWVEETVCQQVNKTVTKKGVKFETKVDSFPCTSTYAKEVCVEVSSLVDATCDANLKETQEVPCTRKYKKQVCQDIDVPSTEICTEIKEQEIEYPCLQIVFEEKCTTVPYYELEPCEAVVAETELEPCEVNFRVTECTPQDNPQMGTCFKDEQVDFSETCYRVESDTACEDVITTRVVQDALAKRARASK